MGEQRILSTTSPSSKRGGRGTKGVVNDYFDRVTGLYDIEGSCGSEQMIAEFVVELWKFVSSRNFGQFLDEALRNRFVCGIRSEHIQKRLLTESMGDLHECLQTGTSSGNCIAS